MNSANSTIREMLLIHYYNLTYFQENDVYWMQLRAFLIIESIFYIWDIIHCSFFVFVILTAKQFHFNFSIILAYIFIIHIVDNFVILMMRLQGFIGVDDKTILDNPLFIILMFSTVVTVMSAMCVMPLLTFERCFATYYLSDYETNERRHISYSLILIVLLIGFVNSAACLDKSNTIYVIVLLSLLNMISLMLNLLVHFYNKKQYKKYHGSEERQKAYVTYSLTKRFQISENIKSIHILNVIIMYMGLMNGLVVGSLLICSTHISPESQAVCSIVLDVCIFLYSNSFPQIMICYGDKFKKKVRRSLSKVGFRLSNQKVLPLRNTFGAKMDDCANIDNHFSNLRSSWDSAIARIK